MAIKPEFKFLTLKRWGWKRIAKNTMRFGWKLDQAVDHTTTYEETSYSGTIHDDYVELTPSTSYSSTRRMELDFSREPNKIMNIGAIRTLEFFYNIFYKLRQMFSFLLKASFIVTMIIGALSQFDELLLRPFTVAVAVSFFGWLSARIIEDILPRISEKIIKIID